MLPRRPRNYSLLSLAALLGCGNYAAAQNAPATPAGTTGTTASATPASTMGRSGNDVKQPVRIITNNAPQETAGLLSKTGGSLLRASLAVAPDPNQAKFSQLSFFSVPEPQPRTIKKHDLVTIITREESAFTSHGLADLKREADIEARIEEFIRLKLQNISIQGGAQGATPPGIKITGNRTFKGEATVDREDSLTLRVTAEVVDVKPNGTLILQGRKQIKVDEEEQLIVLTGTCRAEDINADNTVLSTQLFDLQLQKNHKGAVRETQRRGWLLGLLDAVAPF